MRRMLIQIDLVASPCRKSLSNGVVECIAGGTAAGNIKVGVV